MSRPFVYLIFVQAILIVFGSTSNIPVIHNVSLIMFDYNSTVINNISCDYCLCTMLLNSTIYSLNYFRNNNTCQLFFKSLETNSFLLTNNLESSIYFKSIPVINTREYLISSILFHLTL